MNLFKCIKIAFFTIACIYSTDSIVAVAPEFLPLTSAQAKVLATRYKTESLRPRMLPHYVHLTPLGTSTDTDLLLKGITDGNNNAYVAFAKGKIKALVGTWVDGLLVGNGKFVVTAVTVLSLDGADRTKSTFNTALQNAIDRAVVAVPASADAKIRTLKATKTLVNEAIATAVKGWVDTILPGDDTKKFLDKAIAIAAVNPPTGLEKGHFKTAVAKLIKTF